jgi:hypothetical protein
MEAYYGNGGVAPLILWPRRQMDVSGQLHAPAALPPGERAPGTHWIGGWVGPRAVLDAVVKRKFHIPRTPIIQRMKLLCLYEFFFDIVNIHLSTKTSSYVYVQFTISTVISHGSYQQMRVKETFVC